MHRSSKDMPIPQPEHNNMVFSSRGDANKVLTPLKEIARKYEYATVMDLYDLVGMTGNFSYDHLGWYDLSEVHVLKVSEGYKLDLPEPSTIKARP